MRVGCPGIRVRDSSGEMSAGRSGGRPETERAIHVDPRTCGMSDATNLRDRIERAGVHVASLDTDDGRAGDRRELIGQDSSLVIYRNLNDATTAKAEQA